MYWLQIRFESLNRFNETCKVYDEKVFWTNINNLIDDSFDFVYPSSHLKKNIGIASKEMVSNFGSYIDSLETFTKQDAIEYEDYICNHYKYKHQGIVNMFFHILHWSSGITLNDLLG